MDPGADEWGVDATEEAGSLAAGVLILPEELAVRSRAWAQAVSGDNRVSVERGGRSVVPLFRLREVFQVVSGDPSANEKSGALRDLARKLREAATSKGAVKSELVRFDTDSTHGSLSERIYIDAVGVLDLVFGKHGVAAVQLAAASHLCDATAEAARAAGEENPLTRALGVLNKASPNPAAQVRPGVIHVCTVCTVTSPDTMPHGLYGHQTPDKKPAITSPDQTPRRHSLHLTPDMKPANKHFTRHDTTQHGHFTNHQT